MDNEKEQDRLYICIDPKCDSSNRMFKAKNDQHPHKTHDHQLYTEFQKTIKTQFPQPIREQINQLFNKEELVKIVQQRSVQMHEYVKNFEENVLKCIETYDILGADKQTINTTISQIYDQNPPQSVNNNILHLLKFNKLGPQKVLEKWKKEVEIIAKELTTQVDAALKALSTTTLSSYTHIQHLQSPQILQKMKFKWSQQLKAGTVTVREEAIYEKGNGMGLACMEQILEKDQIQSITIDIKERAGTLYIGVIDMNERKQKGRKAFSFHDWSEVGHGLYLLYHGGYIFCSNNAELNAKKTQFTYDQGDKLILTWNGSEQTVKILKVGSMHQHEFKVNGDGEYHFAAGLFKSEIRMID